MKTWGVLRVTATALLFGEVGFAMAEIQKIEFTLVPGAPPAADALRLARDSKGVFLAVSKTASTPPMGASTTISALAPLGSGAKWSTIATLAEIVPAQPGWDICLALGDGPAIVHERPGGAINALLLRTAPGSAQALTGAYPLQSFSEPRFARPSGGPPHWVTAVADNRTCVALPLGPNPAYRRLGECAAGMLVTIGSGFVYIFKTPVAGLVRGNLISPGRLHVETLDAEMHPTAPATDLFSGIVFEFDADLAGDKLVIVATTPEGLVVASAPARSLIAKFTGQELASHSILTNPAIVTGPSGKATFAALDATVPGEAHVVTAELAIP